MSGKGFERIESSQKFTPEQRIFIWIYCLLYCGLGILIGWSVWG